MIKTLTSWRGIFAVCIVCFHFGMHKFDQMTYLGVTFFLMVSGFLVGLRHDRLGSTSQFYRRRLWRIFPLHWLALAAVIMVDVLARSHQFTYGSDLLLHVLLLQSWSTHEAVYYGYSTHSWFLSALLLAILVTPLLLKWMRRASLGSVWLILGVVCMGLTTMHFFTTSHWHNYTYVCPAIRLIDYALGIALAITLKRTRFAEKTHNISFATASLIELAVAAVAAVPIMWHATGSPVAEMLETSPLWWIPSLLLITSCYVLSGHEGMLGRVVAAAPLVWLGGLSFEIYILQRAVNNAFNYLVAPLFGHFGIMIYGYSFACTMTMLIIVAVVVNRWFTGPISRWQKRNK